MVKICAKHKPRVDLKIGFRSIFDAKRANKYLGKNETSPISLTFEISNHQKEILDNAGVDYYIIE